MSCSHPIPWSRATAQKICTSMRTDAKSTQCNGKTSTIRAIAMTLCGFYSSDTREANHTYSNDNPFLLSKYYFENLKTYLQQDVNKSGVVVEWIRNSNDFHDDSELTYILNEFILKAPHLYRRDHLIRVIKRSTYLPSSDRLMSCSFTTDDIQKVNWTLVWGSQGKFRWNLDDNEVEHCCLLELNVEPNVPRMYCINVAGISQQQSEVILPLNCIYIKQKERVEFWDVKRIREHSWPIPAEMRQYYVYPSDEGFHIKIRILTFNVHYEETPTQMQSGTLIS